MTAAEPRGVTLAEFLLARIAEDEERARDSICKCGGPACTVENGWFRYGEAAFRLDSTPAAVFVVHNSPARVLAECAAKRRIVEEWRVADEDCADNVSRAWESVAHRETLTTVLRALASVYADHPDFDPDWA